MGPPVVSPPSLFLLGLTAMGLVKLVQERFSVEPWHNDPLFVHGAFSDNTIDSSRASRIPSGAVTRDSSSDPNKASGENDDGLLVQSRLHALLADIDVDETTRNDTTRHDTTRHDTTR